MGQSTRGKARSLGLARLDLGRSTPSARWLAMGCALGQVPSVGRAKSGASQLTALELHPIGALLVARHRRQCTQ